MARIQKFKKSNRGREIHCMKCGKPILPGDFYLKAEPYSGPPIIRCTECGLKGYETSGSYYIQRVGALVENWRDTYGDYTTAAEDIASELEDIRGELEDNFYNIPEQLQDGAAGSLLQERMDEIEDVIVELESIDYDEIRDEVHDEAVDELDGEFDPTDPDREFETLEEWEQALEDKMWDLDVDARVGDAIDEALSSLTY